MLKSNTWPFIPNGGGFHEVSIDLIRFDFVQKENNKGKRYFVIISEVLPFTISPNGNCFCWKCKIINFTISDLKMIGKIGKCVVCFRMTSYCYTVGECLTIKA